MNLYQLTETLESIKKMIADKLLLLHYQTLANQLYSIASGSDSDDEIQVVEDKKKIITRIHTEFSQESWSDIQVEFIKKFNKNDLLGKKAIKRLQQVFVTFKDKPFEQAQEIEQIINDYDSLVVELTSLLKSLGTILFNSDEHQSDDQGLNYSHLYISFEEGTFFQHLSILEKFSRIWNRILMSFMYLTCETIKPTFVSEISSKTITFNLEPEAIKALTYSAVQVLKGYKKVLEIRRLQLEINNLNLSNKNELEDILEDEVINIVDIISLQVSMELVDKYDLSRKIRKEEIRRNIQIALKQIVNFIEKGGKIDSPHSKELRELIERIILIIKNIKELELCNKQDKKYHFEMTFEEEELEKF